MQRIDIDTFRWTVERLLTGETVLRADINAHCIGRASSGVVLILASVPLFELTTERGKSRPQNASRCKSQQALTLRRR